MGTVQNQPPNIERKNCIPYAHFIEQIEGIIHGSIDAGNKINGGYMPLPSVEPPPLLHAAPPPPLPVASPPRLAARCAAAELRAVRLGFLPRRCSGTGERVGVRLQAAAAVVVS